MNNLAIIFIAVAVTILSFLWYRYTVKKEEQRIKEREDAYNELEEAKSELEDALNTRNLAVIANARDNLVRVRERYEDACDTLGR